MEGEVVTHTYARAGTYQVKLSPSGGVATSQKIEAVTVTNLLQHQYQQFPLLM
jgi:PKD repeat protein